jgi:sugar lactone lactonase YvrE
MFHSLPGVSRRRLFAMRISITVGGALLVAGASVCANSQTVSVNPQNSGLNVGSVNVCPGSQTTPAPCSETATLTFQFTSGGSIGVPAVLTQGAANLDFTDAGTGTCTTNGTGHIYNNNDTCTVNVIFKPRVPGARYGAAELLDTSGNLLATGYVQGTGVGPLVTFANSTSGGYLPSRQSNLGSGSIAPNCVAVDASGNLFITDGNDVKEILAVNGSIPASPTIRILATGFSGPYCVAVGGSGNVFVADRGADSAKEIVAAGGYATVKTLASGLGGPNGVAVDGSGNVFVADWDNSTVKEILAAGGYTTVKNLVGGSFQYADYVSVDGNGNVFVADFGNGAVKEIMASGGYTTVKTLQSGLSDVSSVAVDASGNLFVTLWGEGIVEEIVAAGGYTTIHALSSGYTYLNSVAVDASGNVFVPDGAHSRVVQLNYADPPSLTFAKTAVGGESSDSPQTVTVANIGNFGLAFSPPATGTNPTITTGFTLDSSSTCPQLTTSSAEFTLASGASCTYAVNFKPLSAEAYSGSLMLTNDTLNAAAPGYATQTVPFSGTGIAVTPAVSLSTTSLAFGSIAAGASSASQSVTLTNSGDLPLLVGSITLTGANASSFVFANSCGSALAAGASCIIHGHFAPTTTGAMTAAVTITDNAAGSPQSIALSGTGVVGSPAVSLSAASLSYGTQAVGATSAPQTVNLTNTGNGTLTISSIAVTGAGGPSFGFANSCGTTLAAGASCIIHGHFEPTTTGALTAAVTITDNAAGSPQTIALSGTGVVGSRGVSLSAASLSYGTVSVGGTSLSQSVTLTNTGDLPLLVGSIAVTGANASSFVFASSCGTTLAAGANCVIHGHFAPTSTGALSAAVTITDNAAGSPQSVALTGTGTTSTTVSLSATSVAFGNELAGSLSASQSVTLRNTSSSTVTISSIAVTGANASSFVFASSCGSIMAVGANCTIHGHFAPTAAGAVTAAVTITDNATGSPQSIALTGTGTVSLSATSLSFGNQAVGTSSASQSVTLTNTGSATLRINSITVTGTDASAFVFANSCGTSLAAGANCTIHGHFAPTTTGAVTAAITISDTTTNSLQSIALTGTGVTPATVSLSTASLSFGSMLLGELSNKQYVYLTNTGGTPLVIGGHDTNAQQF